MKFTSEVIAGLRNQFKYLFDQYGYNTPDQQYLLHALDEIEHLQKRVEELEGENSRLSVLLHDEMNQLELTIDLSNKRWIALNNIYTDGEKHNANWCKRKAQEGLGIK